MAEMPRPFALFGAVVAGTIPAVALLGWMLAGVWSTLNQTAAEVHAIHREIGVLETNQRLLMERVLPYGGRPATWEGTLCGR